MVSGYDQRSRQTGRMLSKSFNASGVNTQFVISKNSLDAVTSYRSDVRGTSLSSRSVDLYSGFLKQESGLAAYLNPGPRLLAELEAAGLAEDSDYVNEGKFLDNGHPFTSERRSWNTSLRTKRDYKPQGLIPWQSGYPFVSTLFALNSTDVPRADALWRLPDGASGGTSRRFSLGTAIPSPTINQLQSDGTKLISLARPDRPPVDTFRAVGEILIDLPILPGRALLESLRLSGVGGEYLNVVFGLIPTYSDAVSVAKAMKTASTRLLTLRKQAGKPHRSQMGFPTSNKAEIFICPTGQVWIQGGASAFTTKNVVSGFGSSTSQEVDRSLILSKELFMSESRKVWFNGSFTYTIPTIPGLSGKLEMWLSEYDRLLGLSLNSKNAWQLAPWSWLIDWFVDIVSNLEAINTAHDDNLVINYGYAMEQIDRTIVAKSSFAKNTAIAGVDFVSTYSKLTSKKRIRANPYGFVTESDSNLWSSYRLAVLGALGISRL